jgi:hypothetical protein
MSCFLRMVKQVLIYSYSYSRVFSYTIHILTFSFIIFLFKVLERPTQYLVPNHLYNTNPVLRSGVSFLASYRIYCSTCPPNLGSRHHSLLGQLSFIYYNAWIYSTTVSQYKSIQQTMCHWGIRRCP